MNGAGFWLYRLYDAEGALLYVGCPASTRTRLQAGLCRKDWLGEIAHIQVQEFATLQAALAEEAVALVAEGPLHNVTEAPHSHE